MNRLFRFLQTTIVGGIVILVPVIVLVLLVGKVLRWAERLAQPMAKFLPLDTAAGIVVANLILLFVAALVCFGAGLIAKWSLAGRAVQKAESKFLWNIPGYVQFKAIINSLNPDNDFSRTRAIMCRAGDRWQFGYEIERALDGRVVVFLPGAPNAWSGTVFVVDPEGVRAIDASVMQVAGALRRLGRGAGQIVRTQA